MNYKHKYIKYKNKYLKLKNIYGGASLLKHLPGGKRSGLSRSDLIEMVTNKEVVFYLDKSDPNKFSESIKSELKPGYHIHKIFQKGEKFLINGKEYIHEGSTSMDAFVKIIKDNDGKEWAIYDHNLDAQLDIHLKDSFPQ
jgi:hypothetical protein